MPRKPIEYIDELIHFPPKYSFLANKTENEITELTLKLVEKEQVSSLKVANMYPRTTIQKYFYWYIIIHLSSYLNYVKIKVNEAKKPFEKNYIVNYELGKVLNPLLKDLAKCLASNRHRFFYSTPTRRRTNADYDNNEFIGILLKEALCLAYFDIQSQYEEFVLQDIFSISDLKRKYFDSHTKESLAYGNEKSYFQLKNPKKVPESLGLFQISYKDIHSRHQSQPKYDDLIINKHKFGEIELQMYKHGLINAEYSFIPCKEESHKTLMALIYHEIIRKGIFRTNFTRQNRNSSPTDYRKYLDDRYSVDTSQQFRRLTSKQREYALEKLPWITEIPHLF